MSRRGAYGLAICGMDDAAEELVEALPEWPELSISHADPGAQPDGETAAEGVVDYRILEEDDESAVRAEVRLHRRPLAAVFRERDRPFSTAELVHPHLAVIASYSARWFDRLCFHAGGFVLDGEAWAVLGERASGKTSLLAQLSELGVGILADDLVVVDGDSVFAGPRCLDLREGAARWFDRGTLCRGVVAMDPRWRVRTAPVEPAVRLRGWILPVWAPRVSVHPLAPGDRIAALSPHFHGGTRDANERLLDFVGLPCLRFERPPEWESMAQGAMSLLDHLLGGRL